MATAVNQFQTNNSGSLPTSSNVGTNGATFIEGYLGGASEFTDPDGTAYKITVAEGAKTYSGTSMDHTVYLQTKAQCSGEQAIASQNARDYAILYKLEGSGVYCIDNR